MRVEYGGAFGTNSFTFTAFIPRRGSPSPSFVFICNRPTAENIDPTRRVKSALWPAEEIVARGYAAIAPRLVCIGSATEDDYAGPYGEYQTARYASPAWRIFGMKGFVSDGFPDPERPQQEGDISYHIRTGKHDLTVYDWNVYMDFADRHGWRGTAR